MNHGLSYMLCNLTFVFFVFHVFDSLGVIIPFADFCIERTTPPVLPAGSVSSLRQMDPISYSHKLPSEYLFRPISIKGV